mgnify:CR=1 FL=1|tara:strand:- start:1315 stop:3249 length:1935 start_codon:yes stop_codon:yes gene_type:complete
MVLSANRTDNMIQIGDRRFHTVGDPVRTLVSQFPEKRVEGDYGITSNPITSLLVFSDHRDGIGVENISGATQSNWYSTLSLRHNNHLVLQRQAIDTDANAALSASGSVSYLAELSNEIYQVTSENKLYKYNNGTNGWGSVLHTFDSDVTDVITAPLNGTDTMIAAVTSGAVEFSTNGTSWTDETTTTGIKYLAYGFREKLWGISADGTTYFANTLAGSGTTSWTEVAKLQLSFGEVTKLLVGPGPNPTDDILYAATQVGLYAYNNVSERWIATDLTLPFHESNGTGTTVFRNAIYVNAGMSVYQYTPSMIGARVSIMGPDLNDGLPSNNQGIIRAMHGTHQELVAIIDGADTATDDDESLLMEATGGIHNIMTINAGLGYPTVLGWNTRGWEIKFAASIAGKTVCNNMLVTNAYSSYRLWWAINGDVQYGLLPVGIENPNQVETTRRNSTGTWISPWFDANLIHQNKTALEWHLDSTSPSTSETITLSYAIDYDNNDTAYTVLGVNNKSGNFQYEMPNKASPEGVPFRAIRAKLEFARGSNITQTPDMKKLALVYKPTLETLWGWDVTLDLSRDADGYTPSQQREYLIDTANSRVLVPYAPSDNNDGNDISWVFLANARAAETPGFRDTSNWIVTLAEARSDSE